MAKEWIVDFTKSDEFVEMVRIQLGVKPTVLQCSLYFMRHFRGMDEDEAWSKLMRFLATEWRPA